MSESDAVNQFQQVNTAGKSPQEIPIKNIHDARKILELGKSFNPTELLQDADVLFYGDIHNDYAIPDYLLTQVDRLKRAGVTSFGFEINPGPKIRAIFDEINSGKLERIKDVDWSFGWSNPIVRKNKEKLVRSLVKAKIEVYPFASWDKEGDIKEDLYTGEVEQQAAAIINENAKKGKTVVFVGMEHAQYGKDMYWRKFPHTADAVVLLGSKVESILFAGGMHNPGLYDRSSEALLQRAIGEKKLTEPLFIDTTDMRVEDYSANGIILLPVVPFAAANEPMLKNNKLDFPRRLLQFIANKK